MEVIITLVILSFLVFLAFTVGSLIFTGIFMLVVAIGYGIMTAFQSVVGLFKREN